MTRVVHHTFTHDAHITLSFWEKLLISPLESINMMDTHRKYDVHSAKQRHFGHASFGRCLPSASPNTANGMFLASIRGVLAWDLPNLNLAQLFYGEQKMFINNNNNVRVGCLGGLVCLMIWLFGHAL